MRLCGCVGTTKAFPESGTIEGVRGSTRNREMRPESEREGGGGGRGKERKGRREQREKDGRKGSKLEECWSTARWGVQRAPCIQLYT